MSTTVIEYVEAVAARSRVPLEPANFVPDWDDQPAQFKTYPDAVRIPLAAHLPAEAARRADGGFDLGLLSTQLLLSYGLLTRRLRLNWNDATPRTVSLPKAIWGRGTPSGGGLYPLEIYWVSGPSGPFLPGVYHYSPGHHAMERLGVGDRTAAVRAALPKHPAVTTTDQFLLVSGRFWRNAFKYATFSYHVVTQDVGALLGSWSALARAWGVSVPHLLWFADEQLNRIVGIDTDVESVLAVVPLPWPARAGAGPATDAGPREPAMLGGPALRAPAAERSRRVRLFPRVTEVHRATLVEPSSPPGPLDGEGVHETDGDGVHETAGGGMTLPAASPVPDPCAALLTRRSSFGGFRGNRPLTQHDLATVLASAAVARAEVVSGGVPTDRSPWPPLTRLAVVANRVSGLPIGCYRYSATGHRLEPVSTGPVGRLLQRSYQLQNYNLDQLGAVLAIVGRPRAVLSAYGGRGYRLLNAEVGMVAQAIYLAAAGASLGCGAVLGLDTIAMDALLGLTGTGQQTLLFLLLGHEHAAVAEVTADLVRAAGPETVR